MHGMEDRTKIDADCYICFTRTAGYTFENSFEHIFATMAASISEILQWIVFVSKYSGYGYKAEKYHLPTSTVCCVYKRSPYEFQEFLHVILIELSYDDYYPLTAIQYLHL